LSYKEVKRKQLRRSHRLLVDWKLAKETKERDKGILKLREKILKGGWINKRKLC